MPEKLDIFSEKEPSLPVSTFLDSSEAIFVKKLSLNDRDWARLPNKHQAGVYVPPAERDNGFFPPLVAKQREKVDANEIREAFFEIEWVGISGKKKARLAHYTSKRAETHLTGLPKPAFSDLAPASFLVIGRRGDKYRAVTIDSESEDCDLLGDLLSLPPDFRSGVFALEALRCKREEKEITFLEEVVKAFFDGTIIALAAKYASMPTTAALAATARARFLADNGLENLDPYAMAKPGDALRTISRGIEYEIFKDFQMRARAIELVRLLLGDDPSAVSPEKALRAIVLEYPKIDAIMLSAAQQRKSRAGYSFEHHIEAMLSEGKIPFQKQVVIEAKKRPDFILPSLALYDNKIRTDREALVLSAKTTLRERWKQVHAEIKNCDLYIATVDENIAENAIIDMASQGICLVVPESLKNSDTTEYKRHASVISFEKFFSTEIKGVRWPLWEARGLINCG
ncbi:hypothetical protein K2O51_12475 [Cupriavidus pinatubonensis]|uniref:type II restriction endonuclease n=1 Tax=Cupriavidus pinatubonensis TaxID=248026 RepID=UPI001C7303B8|nr:type II restriction endonuclease [Cupriavidus pinatubonensis]QYY31644.1 hypothetical protein K2O51_12475 [Cupriavidus pinatubonensis]